MARAEEALRMARDGGGDRIALDRPAGEPRVDAWPARARERLSLADEDAGDEAIDEGA
jgi:hypothetical protein